MLWWKFAKVLVSFLKVWVSFSLDVASIFSAIKQNSPMLFFSSNIIYFDQKKAIKVQIFVLESKFVKFLMSILNWQVNSSSIFASLFIGMTQISPVKFKLKYFPLWIKVFHKSQFLHFRTCSGKNSLNSSCHFWKHESVFLQMLHQYSVPSNKTPLYLFYHKHYILCSKEAH